MERRGTEATVSLQSEPLKPGSLRAAGSRSARPAFEQGAVWYTEATADRPDVLLAVAADGRGVVVWEVSTAVRRRILLRSIAEGGRSLGPVRTLSQAIKAWAPDVTVVPGGFLVAWHEERFPANRTIVQHFTTEEVRR